jgi:hypothetical protein
MLVFPLFPKTPTIAAFALPAIHYRTLFKTGIAKHEKGDNVKIFH